MSGSPIVSGRKSGRQTVAALRRIGYEVVRQKGSHIRLRHPLDGSRAPLTVPDHKELNSGTLRTIIRDAGLSVDEFQDPLG